MSRTSTTIEHELERLRAKAPGQDHLARKAALFEAQVAEFARQLEPDVKTGLEREATSDFAAEWVEEATQALVAIEPELRERLQREPAFKEAAARVRAELNGQMLREAIRPSDDDIRGHAHELAQCVLANWLSVLEHAKQDNPGTSLALSANGLPRGVDHAAVLEGVEDFAVPINTVASAFNAYRDSLKESGLVVELAPSLYLAHQGGDAYLAPSKEAADGLVLQKAKKAQEEPTNFLRWSSAGKRPLSPLRAVLNRLDPYLKSSPGILWRNPKPSFAAAAMEQQVEKYATAYVLQALADPGDPLAEGVVRAHVSETVLDEPRRKITIDLANYLLLDYKQALDDNVLKNTLVMWEQHGVEKRLTEEARGFMSVETLESAYRASISATACTFLGLDWESEDLAVDPGELEEFFSAHPEAKTALEIAVQATKEALAMPGAQSIAQQMKQEFAFDAGSDPENR